MMYFDNCATTQVFDAAADTALRFMKRDYFNSSAPYTAALFNEKELQRARSAAAAPALMFRCGPSPVRR